MIKGRRTAKTFLYTVAASLVMCLIGCVSKRPGKTIVTVDQLLSRAAAVNIKLENPFALDAEMKADVAKGVGFQGTPLERIHRLIRYLNNTKGIHFAYASNKSLTARQAYRARKGDCLAYTNLFLGMARYLKLPVYFVHVDANPHFYERRGVFFVSSHMAVGYSGATVGMVKNPYDVIIDFTRASSNFNLVFYRPIDDAWAVTLYYNNVAVNNIVKGNLNYAEKLLRFLITQKPNIKELYNNLAIVMMRLGQGKQALQLLERGIKRFPSYEPLYTNVVLTARNLGEPKQAKKYAAIGNKVAKQDPFFVFNRGVDEFSSGALGAAVKDFRRALRENRRNPVLYAWLARACLAAGRNTEGIDAFKRAQKLAPRNAMLDELRAKYPVLKTVPRI